MEKVEEDNGAKNAQRQQISEETLQKVIAVSRDRQIDKEIFYTCFRRKNILCMPFFVAAEMA
jgi:hypothetical protein